MPPLEQTTIQADLRRRVADVGEFFEAGMHAVTDGWARTMNGVMSMGRNPEERASTALRGWFTASDETESVSSGGRGTPSMTSVAAPGANTAASTSSRRFPRGKQKSGTKARTAKEELGTSTWVFLHTLAAQYPDKPSTRQKRDVKNLIDIMTRLYPCGECAEHFQEIVKVHPPQVESRESLSRWMCDVHNVVNRSLNKPVFNCAVVSGRWQGLDDDGSCGDERGCRLRTY